MNRISDINPNDIESVDSAQGLRGGGDLRLEGLGRGDRHYDETRAGGAAAIPAALGHRHRRRWRIATDSGAS